MKLQDLECECRDPRESRFTVDIYMCTTAFQIYFSLSVHPHPPPSPTPRPVFCRARSRPLSLTANGCLYTVCLQ